MWVVVRQDDWVGGEDVLGVVDRSARRRRAGLSWRTCSGGCPRSPTRGSGCG
jgi:hypothetical protein